MKPIDVNANLKAPEDPIKMRHEHLANIRVDYRSLEQIENVVGTAARATLVIVLAGFGAKTAATVIEHVVKTKIK